LPRRQEELPTRTLDSHIYRLRKKLELNGVTTLRLQMVYGQGYRLIDMPHAPAAQIEEGLEEAVH
jgi:DNA-binding response OmpR family regulator